MKRTKIICTVGPATDDKKVLVEMIKNGMNVARFNFSHGSHEEHKMRMELVKEAAKEVGQYVALLLDTKGPEIRTGIFKQGDNGDAYMLKTGQPFTLTTKTTKGDEKGCSVSYANLPHEVKPGDKILIDDGLVELEVKSVTDTDIKCIVNNDGIVKSYKGINVPDVNLHLPALTQKDYDDIIMGVENDIDFIAASFVRKAEDIAQIRGILDIKGASHIKIIAKIENQEGINNSKAIVAASDGIMVARGDLGVEIAAEKIPVVQKQLIKACNMAGKPVITATQMLDSMMRNPRPTRAEITDVANAIFDGTDAIMLSGETAAGKYPVESVKTMYNIAVNTEEALDYKGILDAKGTLRGDSVTDAISHATCMCASDLKTDHILTCTTSGDTARMIARFRPQATIVASTSDARTARQLSIVWGVVPFVTEAAHDLYLKLFEAAIQGAIVQKLIKKGEVIVITAGVPVGRSGATNLMRVHTVGDPIL